MVNQNYADCTTLVLDTNEWVKVSESYDDINPIFIQWWKDATEKPPPDTTE
jgi:hypothetical protein